MADRATWTGDRRIVSRDDARRVLAEINADARRAGTAALARAVRTADDTVLEADASQILPAVPEFVEQLLPWPGGLRRGATVAAVGSTSLIITLLAGAMTAGGWCAVVGMPSCGVLAAAEAGVPVERLALVPEPGPDWPTVVGALIDGVDMVVVATPAGIAETTTRALMSRARERRCVLIPTAAWPGSDLVIECTGRRWTGLGRGHGRLRMQELELIATGRGRAVRPKTTTIVLPAGADTRPGVIPPPPPGLYDDETDTADTGPWRHLEPSESPTDAWAELQDAVPPPGRRLRW